MQKHYNLLSIYLKQNCTQRSSFNTMCILFLKLIPQITLKSKQAIITSFVTDTMQLTHCPCALHRQWCTRTVTTLYGTLYLDRSVKSKLQDTLLALESRLPRLIDICIYWVAVNLLLCLTQLKDSMEGCFLLLITHVLL